MKKGKKEPRKEEIKKPEAPSGRQHHIHTLGYFTLFDGINFIAVIKWKC